MDKPSSRPLLPDAIHRAAHHGDLRAVLTWLASPAGNPRARNEAGETILCVAVRGLVHLDAAVIDDVAPTMVKALVASGVPVNAVDCQGRTALHWAVLERPSVVMALLSMGANPGSRGPNGDTPLHALCLGGGCGQEDGSSIASMLLALGADATALNGDGLAPGGIRGDFLPAPVPPPMLPASARRPRA